MTSEVSSWEIGLLEKASTAVRFASFGDENDLIEPALLHCAYEYCERLTYEHSRTFHLASGLLPSEKRRAARALYAFCRTSDDLVDCFQNEVSRPEARRGLDAWKIYALDAENSKHVRTNFMQQMVGIAWADTRKHFAIPTLYAEQLIEGVAADLSRVRFRTFEDLAGYAYSVASTVGLMSMHIIGYAGPQAIPYAIRLGVALQLTNILRDVGEDWRNGRLYLPLDELAEYGLCEEDIAKGQVTNAWRAFMRFQIERTRKLYADSAPGIAMLARDGRFAIAAAARLYEAILDNIEKQDYDVFHRRARVGFWGKIRRLPRIWWEAK
jgi:phytoene synthase